MRLIEAFWALFKLELQDNVINIRQKPHLVCKHCFQPTCYRHNGRVSRTGQTRTNLNSFYISESNSFGLAAYRSLPTSQFKMHPIAYEHEGKSAIISYNQKDHLTSIKKEGVLRWISDPTELLPC